MHVLHDTCYPRCTQACATWHVCTPRAHRHRACAARWLSEPWLQGWKEQILLTRRLAPSGRFRGTVEVAAGVYLIAFASKRVCLCVFSYPIR